MKKEFLLMHSTFRIMLALLLLLICAGFAIAAAVPEGPGTLTVSKVTSRPTVAAPTVKARAGNITQMRLVGQTVTQSWQGYVGNVSGTITLDDAKNFTLYDWALNDPEGEVYATYLSSVDWATGNIVCWNWSNVSASNLQKAEVEQKPASGDGTPNGFSGMWSVATDVDGLDETFNYSIKKIAGTQREHSSFFVGGQFINGSFGGGVTRAANGGGGPCANAYLYNGTPYYQTGVGGDSAHRAPFQEMLLYYRKNMGNGDGIIFTSILKSNYNGYNNQSWDFEMIVPENGHSGNTTSTTYYFYVELE